ncbi:DEAD/DEAH box helicase [Amycolatopsis nivea]|uniref:DEAD/DEAH box helicase n=1 Tax=Amycolatopsis nivea TaxID=1644109 RepID=UPI0010702BC6|nr:DEAD/DEAH box helicase [Amycolatopsis nivea]
MVEAPSFRGLFIGLDHYRDPAFGELRFARRDAEVLYALFRDTFGDDSATLVTDAEATKARMWTEMGRLARESTDSDVVLVSFSGHGTPTRELATHDADGERLAETAVPLAEFARLVDRIPARLLIVVLDCCFSGGAWNERLTDATAVGHQPKSLRLPPDEWVARTSGGQDRMDLVRGRGKVILAASGADERAYEKAEFGHGVLTHHFLEALLGRHGTADGDRVSVLKLVDRVLQGVVSHRNGILGVRQNAGFEGSIGDAYLPVFTPGEQYEELGGVAPRRAAPALSSLESHGISAPFIELWRDQVGMLNEVQLAAVNAAGILRGESALVSAPTGSGKTLVGEMAGIAAKHAGKRTVFLLPTRALVNEQYDRFRDQYGSRGVAVIRATGDLRDHLPQFVRGKYDFAVLTYEKFTGLVAADPGLLSRVGLVVVDEIHALFDPNRGPGLEAFFTRLRARRSGSTSPQLIGLSAVLGDPEGLADWLGVTPVVSTYRATPLVEGVLGPDGRLRGSRVAAGVVSDVDEPAWLDPPVSESREELLISVVSALVAERRQVIVFRGTRESVRSTAARLARTASSLPADEEIAALPRGDAGVLHDHLVQCLSGGVAFHLADLSDAQRRVIETSFRRRDSAIRVVVATTTLAQGLNLPADVVLINELKHPTDVAYSVAEYKNMAGRAGRAGHGSGEGRAVILTEGGADSEEKLRRYVRASPEPGRSVLLDARIDLATLVVTALAAETAEHGHADEDAVVDFLRRTLAYRQGRMAGRAEVFPPTRVQQVVSHLVDRGFVRRSADALVLSRLGEIVVRSGISTASVTAIADALREVPAGEVKRPALLCAAQLAEELQDVRFAVSSRGRPAAVEEMRAWLAAAGAPATIVQRLFSLPAERAHAAARRAIASVLWIRGSGLPDIERALQATLPQQRRNDPGPVIQAMRRAAGVTGAVIEIAECVVPGERFGDLPDILPAQIEFGVIAGHVPIAKWAEPELPRDVFVALRKAGLVTVAAVGEADDQEGIRCLGGNSVLWQAVRAAVGAAEAEAAEPRLFDVASPTEEPV